MKTVMDAVDRQDKLIMVGQPVGLPLCRECGEEHDPLEPCLPVEEDGAL